MYDVSIALGCVNYMVDILLQKEHKTVGVHYIFQQKLYKLMNCTYIVLKQTDPARMIQIN